MGLRLHFAAIFFTLVSISLSAQPTLYGLTLQGGSSGEGTLFAFDGAAQSISVKSNFSEEQGTEPSTTLLYTSDGLFYGTTSLGGSNGYGTLFSFDPQAETLTVLAEFDYETTGAYSFGKLTQLDNGDIIGVSSSGGAGGYGTIWKYNVDSNILSKIVEFNEEVGAYPYSGVIQASDGKLYGVTTNYGPDDFGSLYAYDFEHDQLSLIHSLSLENGAYGFGELIEVEGMLYGMTNFGGANDFGTIFEYGLTSGQFQTRFSFDGTLSGGFPFGGGLTLATDGNLYGTNTVGGQHDDGILFAFSPQSGNVANVFDFDFEQSGQSYSPVMQASDGHLYGMTEKSLQNGIYTFGSIYRVDLSIQLYSTLYEFDEISGAFPYWNGLSEIKPVKDPCIGNEPPIITHVSDLSSPFMITQSVELSVTFDDENARTGIISWGDGTVDEQRLEGQNMFGQHNYLTAGIYSIEITIVDACEEEAFANTDMIIVYDPDGMCVSGAGQINSQRNIDYKEKRYEIKAPFEFKVGYREGNEVPVGKFMIKVNKEGKSHDSKDDDKDEDDEGHGKDHLDKSDKNKNHLDDGRSNTKAKDKMHVYHRMSFKATRFEWLVVNGNKAITRGSGEVNDKPGYSFVISVVDDERFSGNRIAHYSDKDENKGHHREDRIRIRIWNDDGVVYDNEEDASLYAEASYILTRGNIRIHDCEDDDAEDDDDEDKEEEDEEDHDKDKGKHIKGLEWFPNPIKSHLTIRIPDSKSETVCDFFDFSGRKLKVNLIQSDEPGTHTFDLRDLPRGLYILIVQNGSNTDRIKVWKD